VRKSPRNLSNYLRQNVPEFNVLTSNDTMSQNLPSNHEDYKRLNLGSKGYHIIT
jgi:hypothetical protein